MLWKWFCIDVTLFHVHLYASNSFWWLTLFFTFLTLHFFVPGAKYYIPRLGENDGEIDSLS